MATLQELMAEVLGESPAQGHEKKAQANKASSDEVDQVLESLGLKDSGSVKTASETSAEKTQGGNMSLTRIYEEIMGSHKVETAPQEKTASNETTTEEGSEETSAFGELVGEYFNVIAAPYFEKAAADLESEAGKGESPMAHAPGGSPMTSTLGKPADPRLHVNRSASGGQELKVMTGNSSPYSLKENALKKAILRRSAAAPVGNITD